MPSIALTLPGLEVVQELCSTNLLQAWFQTRLLHELLAQYQAEATALSHHWFHEQAISLYIRRCADLDQVLFTAIETSDDELAQECYFRLRDDNASPEELRKLFSSGLIAIRRIGPVAMGEVHASLAEALRKASCQGVRPPIKLPTGELVILKLEERRHVPLSPETIQELEAKLFHDWLETTCISSLDALGVNLLTSPPTAPASVPPSLTISLPGGIPVASQTLETDDRTACADATPA